MANIQPLGQRVLVKRLEAEEKSAGGIYLPDAAQEKPQEAAVIALGTGGKDENGNDFAFSVAVGDKVLISKYCSSSSTVTCDIVCLARYFLNELCAHVLVWIFELDFFCY